MAKIVCVLYEDPVTGYPSTYARDDIPNIERYPGGQTTPTQGPTPIALAMPPEDPRTRRDSRPRD